MQKINRILLTILSVSVSLAYANQNMGSQELSNEESNVLTQDESKVAGVIQQGILEDKELLSFMQEVKSSIKNHNWSAFIGLCSNEHYKAQVRDSQVSTTQYIAEALGLHTQGNNIFESDDSKVDMKVLEKIEDIKFFSIKKHYNEITIKGIVVLKNGKKLNVELMGLYDQDNGYIITGALG